MPGFSGGTGFGTGGSGYFGGGSGYFGTGYNANPLAGANVGQSGYYQAGGAYGYRAPNGSVPGNGGGGQNDGTPGDSGPAPYYAPPPPPRLSIPTAFRVGGFTAAPATAPLPAAAAGTTGSAALNAAGAAARSASPVPSSYSDILQGYADMEAGLAGQGEAQLADIARRYGGYEGKTVQNAISRGLAPQYAPTPTFESGRAGTPLAAMLRGLRYDQEAANRAAMEGINSQRLNIQQQRLSAAERIQSAQAQQANQAAQLQLERDRLAQQNAQFREQLANSYRTTVQFGGSGGGGSGGSGSGGSRGGIPNIGQTTTTKGGNYYDDGARYGGGGPPSGILGGLYGPPSTSGSLDLGGTGGVPYYPTGADNPYGYGEYSFPGMPGGDFAGYGNFDYGLAGWDIGGG